MLSTRKPEPAHEKRESPRRADPASPMRSRPDSLPIAVSVGEFCRLTNLGRTKAYELISSNQIVVCRVGRRTLVLMSSIMALLEGSADQGPGQ